MARSVIMLVVMMVFTLFTPWCKGVTIDERGLYSTKYDHYDVERILNHKRLVTYYAACLTGKGPCTPQGSELKRILPEALQTNCARCTEKQKVTGYYAIRRLKKEYPKIWADLQLSWDPTGQYVRDFETKIQQQQQGGAVTRTPVKQQRTTVTSSPDLGEESNEIRESTTGEGGVPTTKVSSSSTTTGSTSTKSTITKSTTTKSTTTKSTTTARPAFLPVGGGGGLLRPDVGLRLVGNWIESIGSVGTKVLKTGARLADMVLSRVQATLTRPRNSNT